MKYFNCGTRVNCARERARTRARRFNYANELRASESDMGACAAERSTGILPFSRRRMISRVAVRSIRDTTFGYTRGREMNNEYVNIPVNILGARCTLLLVNSGVRVTGGALSVSHGIGVAASLLHNNTGRPRRRRAA